MRTTQTGDNVHTVQTGNNPGCTQYRQETIMCTHNTDRRQSCLHTLLREDNRVFTQDRHKTMQSVNDEGRRQFTIYTMRTGYSPTYTQYRKKKFQCTHTSELERRKIQSPRNTDIKRPVNTFQRQKVILCTHNADRGYCSVHTMQTQVIAVYILC